MRSRMLTVLLLVAATAAFVAACSPEESPAPTATSVTPAVPTTSEEPTPQETVPSLQLLTPEIFQGPFGRTVVEQPSSSGATTSVLRSVGPGANEVSDQAIFQFAGGLPGYRVEYVPAPATSCGSGAPVELQGQAVLQVRFSAAAAHDESGAATVEETDVAVGLPSLLQARQTCDFEGDVTWVLGLASEVDFRVFSVVDVFLIVEVRHP